MRAYAAQGRRQMVARVYRRCCDGLKELGLERSAGLGLAYRDTTHEVGETSQVVKVWSTGLLGVPQALLGTLRSLELLLEPPDLTATR